MLTLTTLTCMPTAATAATVRMQLPSSDSALHKALPIELSVAEKVQQWRETGDLPLEFINISI